MWGRKHFEFIHKSTTDSVGGILMAWNKNMVEVLDSRVGDYSVSILCRNVVDDNRWAFQECMGQQTNMNLEGLV